jgi:hypothetical protein
MPAFIIFSLLYYTVFVNASVLHTVAFLGTFAKLRKATAGFVMPVSVSAVRPFLCMEQLVFYWTNFDYISYLNIFRKPVEKCQILLKSLKKNEYFALRLIYICDNILLNFP